MRNNYITAIIGKRGCGKTTYVLGLIDAYRKAHPDKKILIMDTIDHPLYNYVPILTPDMVARWKTPSVYRMFGGNIKEMLTAINQDLTNCLVIFEDASKYITKNLQKEVRNSCYDSKQKNIDLLFLFHGFAAISPELFRMIDIYTIFKTDNIDYRRGEIVYYDEIKSTWDEVMKSKNKYFKKTVAVY